MFLPGEFHGQRSLAGYSPRGCKESDTTEQLTHTIRLGLELRLKDWVVWAVVTVEVSVRVRIRARARVSCSVSFCVGPKGERPRALGIQVPSWKGPCRAVITESSSRAHGDRTLLEHRAPQTRNCCSVAKLCPTLGHFTDCNMPGLPVLHNLLQFAQVHAHWVSDAIQPSHPLPPLSQTWWLWSDLVKVNSLGCNRSGMGGLGSTRPPAQRPCPLHTLGGLSLCALLPGSVVLTSSCTESADGKEKCWDGGRATTFRDQKPELHPLSQSTGPLNTSSVHRTKCSPAVVWGWLCSSGGTWAGVC